MTATVAAAARRQAERTRTAQGLPATVTDPVTLDQLVDLIGDPDDRRYATILGAHREVV